MMWRRITTGMGRQQMSTHQNHHFHQESSNQGLQEYPSYQECSSNLPTDPQECLSGHQSSNLPTDPQKCLSGLQSSNLTSDPQECLSLQSSYKPEECSSNLPEEYTSYLPMDLQECYPEKLNNLPEDLWSSNLPVDHPSYQEYTSYQPVDHPSYQEYTSYQPEGLQSAYLPTDFQEFPSYQEGASNLPNDLQEFPSYHLANLPVDHPSYLPTDLQECYPQKLNNLSEDLWSSYLPEECTTNQGLPQQSPPINTDEINSFLNSFFKEDML